MPVEITAALIGVGGALLGGVITYFATMRAVHKAERLKAGSEGRDKAIEVMSDFLTEYTALKIQEYPNEILELEHQLERLFKNLDMHGQHDLSREIQTEGQAYLAQLREFVSGAISSADLDRARIKARKGIQQAISRMA